MKSTVILIIALILSACGSPKPSAPSEGAIQTAVAGTLAAQPTVTEVPTLEPSSTPTPAPTDTPVPTATPKPTKTPTTTGTATASLEDLQNEFCKLVTDLFSSSSLVSSVNLCRLGNGLFELEVKTAFLAKDNQPDVSYSIVQGMATTFRDWKKETAAKLTGGDSLTFHLVTYSESGDYRYISDTTFDTLMDVANKRISYSEWVAAANAGFR